MTLLLASLASLSFHACPSTGSGDWPQFRGPGGRAVADDTPITTRLAPDGDVLWKAKLPAGSSSPCIIGGRIFLTGFADGKDVVLAVERSSGKILWTKSFEGPEHPGYFHPDAGPAMPTCAADGERVVAYFANYGLVALDLDGKILWEKKLAHPRYVFGVGSSPLLHEGVVIVPRDGAPEAGVLGLDANDGSELWRIDRFEFRESHGSPFLWKSADRDELVLGGTNRLCGYDPASGERLWIVDGLTDFPCTTPTADADTLYYAAWSTSNTAGSSFWEPLFDRSLDLTDEEKADPAALFERLDQDQDGKIAPAEVPECRAKDAFPFLDGNQSGTWELEELQKAEAFNSTAGENLMVAVARGAAGDARPSHLRWTWKRGIPYVSSPLLYRGRVWLFQAGGLASVIDAKTGNAIVDRQRLADRSEYYVSPVGAAGHVIVASAEGTLYVFAADKDELSIEHTAAFDEELFATPAVLDGVVYLRSKESLWAFGKKK